MQAVPNKVIITEQTVANTGRLIKKSDIDSSMGKDVGMKSLKDKPSR
jgi:hypothetical protein